MPEFTIVGERKGREVEAAWSPERGLTGDVGVRTRVECLVYEGAVIAITPTGPHVTAALDGTPWIALATVAEVFDRVTRVEGDVEIPVFDVPDGAVP